MISVESQQNWVWTLQQMYVVSMENSCVVPIPKHVNHKRIFDVKLQRATFI